MTAFLMQSAIYKAMGIPIPGTVTDLSVGSAKIVNTFCCVFFGLCVLIALLMGCKPKDYARLILDPHVVGNFSSTYGNSVFLMNVGLYGLNILLYYNLIGANMNGVTFGVIFCMLSTCNSGSHPGNIWTITLGYALASHLFQALAPLAGGDFTLHLNTQAIIVGLCFANGLTPISDKFGWPYGVLAAMLHYCMVTTVPELHGSMCLYNGGFTAALVCILVVPALESLVTPKIERRALREK